MSKILFLTTAHNYDDDRIFYHQAKELKSRGFQVKITSLYSDFIGNKEGIEIESYGILHHSTKDKILQFVSICENYSPQCIICSEPLAVIAAKRYVGNENISIIYDITEWYPSMSMLQGLSLFSKIFQGTKYFFIQLYAGLLAKKFIFGEETKKFPLSTIFPFKKSIILPYYPDESYVFGNCKQLKENEITLCYTGGISEDKGMGNFFKTIGFLHKKKTNHKISILIVGATRSTKDETYFANLLSTYSFENITVKKPTDFKNFTKTFAEADICFDLRAFNFENHHSLPIKLFYYMGAGKPIIYSNLKGISQHMDISSFGNLVDPEDAEFIADIIVNYIDNPEIYNKHAKQARNAFETTYNWSKIKDNFVDFATQSLYSNQDATKSY